MRKKKYTLITLFLAVLFISFVFNTVAVYADSLTLKKGMSGNEVLKLQQFLKTSGFLDVEPTGYFGEKTEVAVIKLQSRYDLAQDGIAGKDVYSVITKQEDKKAERGKTVSRGDSDRGDIRQRIIETAKKYIGVPYIWGKASPSGFDSSGLIWYVFKKNGITLPRVSFDIFKAGKSISKEELLPGDIVFFQGYAKGPSHGTIYAGNGNFIHSPSTGKTVSISRLFDDKYYWYPRFYGARRYISDN